MNFDVILNMLVMIIQKVVLGLLIDIVMVILVILLILIVFESVVVSVWK